MSVPAPLSTRAPNNTTSPFVRRMSDEQRQQDGAIICMDARLISS